MTFEEWWEEVLPHTDFDACMNAADAKTKQWIEGLRKIYEYDLEDEERGND